jgi:hypothetical protein
MIKSMGMSGMMPPPPVEAFVGHMREFLAKTFGSSRLV